MPSPGSIAAHRSVILRRFFEGLDQPDCRVLDMGPVCGENIGFTAQRVRKLYVCDMFRRLDSELSKGRKAENVWRHLDYSRSHFHGIMVWDLGDRIDLQQMKVMIERCHSMLVPEGMLVLFTQGKQQPPSGVNSFVMHGDFKLELRPQPHLSLPLNHRQNSEVLALTAAFSPLKSFIYRNGLREFLFQKNLT